MATVQTYTKSGSKATTAAKLNKDIFEAMPTSHELIKQVYVSYLANGRENLAVTKTRGEVRGGGRKPWKQKGTGNARAGSTRGPIWRTGGIVFGPTGEENYRKKVTTNAKRTATRQALSLAADAGKIKVIETFECKDGKVAQTAKLLDKIEATGTVLVVVSHKDILVERATNNLPNVKAIQAMYLNVYDILNADTIVFSQKALAVVDQWLGTTTKAAPAKADKGGDK
jgi:large subunit ribosomal protein L4